MEEISEEEEIQFFEELNEISFARYRKPYSRLCSDRQRIVLDLHMAGFLEDIRNG